MKSLLASNRSKAILNIGIVAIIFGALSKNKLFSWGMFERSSKSPPYKGKKQILHLTYSGLN
tara:strand:+ start:38 stop:223 length:186 start_codon:yes stop_codon:yes gene_type:complete